MQIRVQTYKGRDGQIKQGKSVSLLRYAYDPEKRRSKQVIIGTVDRWVTALPPEIATILTDAEREEFRGVGCGERPAACRTYPETSSAARRRTYGMGGKSTGCRSGASPARTDLGCTGRAGKSA